jgi:chromosomal replication initiator protein
MTVQDQIRTLLEEKLDRQVYDTWCQSLELNNKGENLWHIPAPNPFYRDWLEKELRRPLEDAFKQLFGQIPTLVFKVEEGKGSPQKTFTKTEKPSFQKIPVLKKLPAASEPPRTPPPAPPIREEGKQTTLNGKYTFRSYVVGPSNRFAHAATLAVSENLGTLYNPLFIHGGVGLGKTHLLQSLCHAVLEENPYTKIIYLSCENFVNDYIAAVRGGGLNEFRRRYRNADLLVVDDVHFLVGKEASQEEFFHTFNTLHISQRQIVLSSDQPAHDIPTLKDHLLSRFASGLEARIDAPTFETRLSILTDRAKAQGKDLPGEVLTYIASTIQNNVRELEGAVTKVVGLSALSNRPLTLELAQEALRESVTPRISTITLGRIQETVAQYYRIKVSDFRSRTWRKSTSLPRQICIYLCRKNTSHSLAEIGEAFAGKDHSTIIYSVKKVEKLMSKDLAVRTDVERLSRELQG